MVYRYGAAFVQVASLPEVFLMHDLLHSCCEYGPMFLTTPSGDGVIFLDVRQLCNSYGHQIGSRATSSGFEHRQGKTERLRGEFVSLLLYSFFHLSIHATILR